MQLSEQSGELSDGPTHLFTLFSTAEEEKHVKTFYVVAMVTNVISVAFTAHLFSCFCSVHYNKVSLILIFRLKPATDFLTCSG